MESIKDMRPEGAPDGPDFWHLSQAVLAQDADVDEPGDSIGGLLAEYGYTGSAVVYMAGQRAMLAMKNQPLPHSLDDIIAGNAAVWLDGFLLGVRAGKR